MPYHHFTPNEQYVIAHMTSAGFSQREIGRRLGTLSASLSLCAFVELRQRFA
jgi:IS30 family transposase